MKSPIPELYARGSGIPAIGLGTWTLNGNECRETIINAIYSGYRHIDTAQIYGNEGEIGCAMEETGINRAELFIVTKISPSSLKYDDVVESTRRSLEKLRTDYLDLLLIHWHDKSVPVGETVSAMNSLKESGEVISIGVSNFPPSLVDEAMQYGEIVCNQVEYHPYLSQKKLLEHSSAGNYLITAYCPVAKGRVMKDTVIGEIGSRYGKTPAQVTLRWLFQQGVISVPKSSDPDHLSENTDIFDFELSREDMDSIYSLDRGLHLDPVSHMSKR